MNMHLIITLQASSSVQTRPLRSSYCWLWFTIAVARRVSLSSFGFLCSFSIFLKVSTSPLKDCGENQQRISVWSSPFTPTHLCFKRFVRSSFLTCCRPPRPGPRSSFSGPCLVPRWPLWPAGPDGSSWSRLEWAACCRSPRLLWLLSPQPVYSEASPPFTHNLTLEQRCHTHK